MSLNQLAAEIHTANRHWWHHPATGEPLDRNIGELFMLMLSEVAEAMEGERKDLMDDHLPRRRMAEVELADTMIRILDYIGAKQIKLFDRENIELPPFPSNKGEALFQISTELMFGHEARTVSTHWHEWRMYRVISLIRRYAERHGYDLDGAIAEKRAYNATRADHKAEARLAANGKKW